MVGATTRVHATSWEVAKAHCVALWMTLSWSCFSSHSAEMVLALEDCLSVGSEMTLPLLRKELVATFTDVISPR